MTKTDYAIKQDLKVQKDEILEGVSAIVNDYAGFADKRFDAIEKRLDRIENDMHSAKLTLFTLALLSR